MAGPFENVFYLKVRLEVTIVGIALLGVILVPSIRLILEYYGTAFMWVVWVTVLCLVAIFTFLLVGIPLWMRDPVTFSYSERGIEVVLSSSLLRRPILIPWERVIHIWKPSRSLDQYEVKLLPERATTQRHTTREGSKYDYSSDAKTVVMTQPQLLEIRRYLSLQVQKEIEGYLGTT